MKKIVDYAHLFIQKQLKNTHIFVDFTLGNGHDSAKFFHEVKSLYAFDIQAIAIENAINNYPFLCDANLILDSHENIKQYITQFDIGIFNLGYLPTGDKSITTNVTSTINALNAALDILNPAGVIVVVVYIGHENGKLESDALLQYAATLKAVTVSKFELLNKTNAPYILVFQK